LLFSPRGNKSLGFFDDNDIHLAALFTLFSFSCCGWFSRARRVKKAKKTR
jgi:hypothetical protein